MNEEKQNVEELDTELPEEATEQDLATDDENEYEDPSNQTEEEVEEVENEQEDSQTQPTENEQKAEPEEKATEKSPSQRPKQTANRPVRPNDVSHLFEEDDDEDYVRPVKKPAQRPQSRPQRPSSQVHHRPRPKKRRPIDKTKLPVKAGKLLLAEILISLPIIGIIIALIYAFNKKVNVNIRTYAKLALLWHVVGILILVFFIATDGLGHLINGIFNWLGITGILF